MLKYQWTAYFQDGMVLEQPDKTTTDLTDITKYQEKSDLIYIDLNDGTFAYGFEVESGRFGINGTWFSLGSDIVNEKHIFLEQLSDKRFEFGYTGNNEDNQYVEKTIVIA